MKKKWPVLALCVVLVCSCFGFAACGKEDNGNKGDTFTGAVSEERYDSEEAAVKAFLQTELADVALFTEYARGKELSAKEIDALGLSAEERAAVQSAVSVTVTYSADFTMMPDLAGASKRYTHNMYVLHCTDGQYGFFAPLPKEGEAITQSYLNAVLRAEQYVNCTVQVKGLEYDVIDINFADNMIYAYTEYRYKHDVEKEYTYTVLTDKGFYTARKRTENDVQEDFALEKGVGNGLEIDTVADLIRISNEGFIDDFELRYGMKTKEGFSLMGYGLLLHCRVENGALRKVNVQGGHDINGTIEFSDFGQTEVTLPSEVSALLAAENVTAVK